MNTLEAIQDWYKQHCDGYWEHQYGVRIHTLDNPGWTVKIDLSGTRLEGSSIEFDDVERTEHNWMHCRVTKNRFEAAGGSENLEEILGVFLKWSGSQDVR